METSFPPNSRRPSFRRAFLPLWIALVLSALLLAYDYHARNAPLTRITANVTLENVEPDEGVILEVNGRKQVLDSVVPIGFNKIRIYGPSTETALFDRFIWYGVTDFGAVNLTRSRGSLVAQVTPTPSSYQLVGKRGNWSNADGGFTNVPVGRYRLVSRIGGLVDETEVDVLRNHINRIQVVAKIGSLEVTSVPAEGEFELISGFSNDRRTGKFPETIQHLAEGRYRLIARRPDYQREYQVDIRRNQTNRVEVTFVYGAAEVVTTPAGATIIWAGTAKGKTPLKVINIVPGTYRMETRLEGFDPASVEVYVEGEATANVALPLVNTRYRESMEGARQNMAQKQYGRATKYLEAALVAQPEDPAALKLLPGTRAHAFRDRAEELRQRGDFDEALKALGSALEDLPGDSATMALQEAIQTEKAQTAQQRIESRYRQSIAEAKSFADRQEFERALVAVGEARKLFADRQEVTDLESTIRRDQAKRGAALEEKRRKTELAARPRLFQAAWEQALISEPDASFFETHKYTTTKSAAEVRAALERISIADPSVKLSELNEISDNCFTVKMGALRSFSKEGHFFRVGVLTYEEGKSEIIVKRMGYVSRPPTGRVPDGNKDALYNDVFRLLERLRTQLHAEVFKSN